MFLLPGGGETMTISEITTNQGLFDRSGAMKSAEHIPKRSAFKGDHRDSPPSHDVDMKKGHGPLASSRLDSAKSRLNEMAKSIRHAQGSVETAERYVDRMQAELGRMVKNFPPFPLGSEERVQKLKTLNSYRKIVDQLTFPQNDQVSRGAVTPEAAQGFHRGSEELEIPGLPDGATDEEVRASLEELGRAKEELGQRRERLSRDAAVFIRKFEEHKAEHVGLYPGSREADNDQATAEIESGKVKRGLIMGPGMTLPDAQSQLLSLLN